MATVPTPATQTAGLVVPAATINSQGNLATYLAGRTESGGARRPLGVLRQTVAQSLANATSTAITFDVEDLDYDNGHSTVTNTSRYTANTAGQYQILWGVSFAANATGRRQAWLKLNGTTDIAASAALVQAVTVAAVPTCITGGRVISMNVNDYVELIAFQDSTAALNTSASGSAMPWFCIQWVSV